MSWSTKRRDLSSAAALFAVALALRCLYVWSAWSSPLVRYPMVDARAYHQRALRILAGDWLGDRIFFQDPLYPYFLAGLYAAFGPDSPAVLLAQALLDSLTVLLVCALAWRLFGRGCGLLAGALAAVYPVFFYYDALRLKVPLTTFLIALALFLVVRAAQSERARAWLPAGVVFGVASSTRGNYLLFVPVLLAWLALVAGGGRRTRLARAALFTAGLAVAILPITLRNYLVGGEFVLLTSQAGQNFYIAHHRANNTGRNKIPGFVRINPRYEEQDFRAEAERRSGRELSPAALSRFWFREGLAEIAADPAHFARHSLLKLRLFLNDYEVPDNQNYYFFRERVTPWLQVPLPSYGALLPLSLCGMFFARRNRSAALLTLFFASYAAGVVAFYSLSRYRVPVVPVVIVFASWGAIELFRSLRRMDFARAVPALLFLAVAYPLAHQSLTGHDFASIHFNLGANYVNDARARRIRARELAEAGDPDGARTENARAIELLELALDQFREGSSIRPDHFGLRRQLRSLLAAKVRRIRREGRSEAALETARELASRFPDDAGALVPLAEVYADLGRREEARETLLRALELDPDHEGALLAFVRLRAESGAE